MSTMPEVLSELLPDTARVVDGELVLGGRHARPALAREFGTPVVVYDEATLRAQARAYREAAPGRAGRLRHEGVPVRRRAAAARRGRPRRRRLDRRRARVRAARGHRRRAARDPRQQQGGRAAAPLGRGGRPDRARLARRAGARTHGRREALLDPRHARHRGGHARGDHDRPSRLEVRAAARRRRRGDPPLSRVPTACTCTSARSSCTSARR